MLGRGTVPLKQLELPFAMGDEDTVGTSGEESLVENGGHLVKRGYFDALRGLRLYPSHRS